MRRGVQPLSHGAHPMRRGVQPLSHGAHPMRRGVQPLGRSKHPAGRNNRPLCRRAHPLTHRNDPAAARNAAAALEMNAERPAGRPGGRGERRRERKNAAGDASRAGKMARNSSRQFPIRPDTNRLNWGYGSGVFKGRENWKSICSSYMRGNTSLATNTFEWNAILSVTC
jgi:hypothetical protein